MKTSEKTNVLKIKRLSDSAILPRRATPGSAALDLFAPETMMIPEGRSTVRLEFAEEFPETICQLIFGRSSQGAKGFEGYPTMAAIENNLDSERFDCDVLLGLIDSDYRGCVNVILKNNGRPFFIKRGQSIAQALFLPKVVAVFDGWYDGELTPTLRGEGGFGSSDEKRK